MGRVSVVVVDATGNKEQRVGLPDDIKCGIIMVKLVEKIRLPSVGPDGNPISYKFVHKVTGRQLLESQTLAEAGIRDGDVLRLQPEITAGAVFCTGCGAPNEDGSVACVACGQPIAAPAPYAAPVNPAPANADPFNPAPFNPAPAKPVDKPKLCMLIGMISGALSLIFGLITMFLSTGSTESFISYGGDAYTGIQNSAAQTANNVKALADILKFGLGGLLIVFGIFVICYFGRKLWKADK